MHDLLGMAREGLVDGDDDEVMKSSCRGQMHVHDFRQDQAQQGQEDPFGGQTQGGILLGRAADDGGGKNGILAVRDGFHVQNRIVVGQRVVARVIAERALSPQFGGVHPALDDDLAAGGDLQIVAHAAHHLHALAAQKAREQDFREKRRKRCGGGVEQGGIAAESHGYRHALARSVSRPRQRAVVVHLGVKAQRAIVKDLQAIQAHVAPAILVAQVAHAHGDEGAAVFGPGREHGQFGKFDVLAAQDDLLAAPAADGLGHPAGDIGQQGQLGEFVEEA